MGLPDEGGPDMSGDLGTVAKLRDHYGDPSSRAASKTLDRLDKHCRAELPWGRRPSGCE